MPERPVVLSPAIDPSLLVCEGVPALSAGATNADLVRQVVALRDALRRCGARLGAVERVLANDD